MTEQQSEGKAERPKKQGMVSHGVGEKVLLVVQVV